MDRSMRSEAAYESESGQDQSEDEKVEVMSCTEELEDESRQKQMLNVVNEEYLSKFKLICQHMESEFFSNEFEGQYIFGREPSVFDYALYHDLLTAMLIPRIGKSNELFSVDNRFRLHKVKKMNKWYFIMS